MREEETFLYSVASDHSHSSLCLQHCPDLTARVCGAQIQRTQLKNVPCCNIWSLLFIEREKSSPPFSPTHPAPTHTQLILCSLFFYFFYFVVVTHRLWADWLSFPDDLECSYSAPLTARGWVTAPCKSLQSCLIPLDFKPKEQDIYRTLRNGLDQSFLDFLNIFKLFLRTGLLLNSSLVQTMNLTPQE